ncbi:MAG: CoA-disulfide reductase, partial [Acidaminococcales bacterium]|nr:CoA-disulfide reductase [Acidaminococcales bacterium]
MAKYLVIGGVAAGAAFAAKMRRLDESAEITVFERGPYVSYANCGLPYYIGGAIKDEAELILHTPATLKGRFNL